MYDEYYKTVAYLEGLSKPFGASANPEIYLQRMQYFLDLLGNPEKDLKIVHVTGTAGKGSVSRLVHSMLVNDGYAAGLFTSPYVTSVIEQIQVNELYIAPAEFVVIVQELQPILAQASKGPLGAPSYFEIITAIAFLYFKRKGCEWAVLEVGLGGRYDSTNVVESPRVTAITTIDYDHMNVLGKTLEKIAWDKAGIIKKGSVFFTTEPRPELLDMFEKVCKDIGANFHSVPAEKTGFHQNNIALAAVIARHIGLSATSIEKAIADFKLPARFEIMKREPLVIIDGAHNPLKIQSVVRRIREINRRRVVAVIAFSNDKDATSMIEAILTVADTLVITEYRSGVRKCTPAQDIAAILEKIQPSIPKEIIIDPVAAFDRACSLSAKNDIVVVTGSFYLAGTIRKIFYPEEYILTNRKSF